MPIAKNYLSAAAASYGKQIKVTATTNAGAVTVHQAVNSTTAGTFDEIYLYAVNNDTATRTLTLLWGGTTEPDNAIKISLDPQKGRLLVVDGAMLANNLIVKAYADAANVVELDGFVFNVTP